VVARCTTGVFIFCVLLYAARYNRNHERGPSHKLLGKNQNPMAMMDPSPARSHWPSDDDSLAGVVSANGEIEEEGGIPSDNAIVNVHIGFQLPLLTSKETQCRITRN
jgi:hypothetical protein